MVGDEGAEQAVIVAAFAAHVEGAIGKRVVEQPDRRAAVLARHVERNVLVERIGISRVVAHRVHIGHAEAAAGAVHVAAALAQAEIFLAKVADEIVTHAPVPPAEIIGLGRSVLQQRFAVRVRPGTQKSVQPYRQCELRGRHDQLAAALAQLERRQGKTREVEPVAAFGRDVFEARRYRPSLWLLERAIRQHHHPDDIVFQHEDMRHRRPVAVKRQAIAVTGGEMEDRRAKKRAHQFVILPSSRRFTGR